MADLFGLSQVGKMGVSSVNSNMMNFNNIGKLDEFLGSSDLGEANLSADTLKGMVSKISNGEGLDFSKMNPSEQELAMDLQELTGDKTETINGKNTNRVVDSFSNVLGDYMNNVNTKAKEAENAIQTFASGGNIDLHSVMIASEKASLSMQLTMQMRNKIMQAYKEIQNIRV